jgi:hypothetical protein
VRLLFDARSEPIALDDAAFMEPAGDRFVLVASAPRLSHSAIAAASFGSQGTAR